MDKDFDHKQVPFDWLLCYVSDCSHREECMRYQVCQQMPEGVSHHPCVLPNAVRTAQCPYFHAIKKVRVAIGFQNIFYDVKARDIAQMRSELAAYLGRGGSYFRYRKGALQLSPAQQEWIRKLFRRYGYSEDVRFDDTKDVYVFNR